MSIFTELIRRERQRGRPVRVGVVGTGWFGGGLVRRVAAVRGMTPGVVANRTLARAVRALESAGLPEDHIRVCEDVETASVALAEGCAVATSRLELPALVPAVDVIMEATGNVVVGTEIARHAFEHGKHVVAANPETQCTVGPMLKHLADAAGVVYSDVDGDQGGILAQLYDYCIGLGLEPVVAGNCKGVLKRYATPATQAAFSAETGIKPWIASAAADGTKVNIEMAIVANATGMRPAVPGMVGPQTTLATLLSDFERLGLLDRGPSVEYTLGIPSGTFMVVHGDGPELREEMRYLKMGDGPYYVIYRPEVLCHFAAPISAAEAVLFKTATIAPRGAPIADVVTFAKRDLHAGEYLDGIGGFDTYGMIVEAAESSEQGMLPVGIAEFACLTTDVRKDEPVRYSAVRLDENNPVVTLRHQQDQLFALNQPVFA
jgi:predicted homoserine dehydrogenase-like protein